MVLLVESESTSSNGCDAVVSCHVPLVCSYLYISGCKKDMYLYFEAVSDHVYFVTQTLSLSLSCSL